MKENIRTLILIFSIVLNITFIGTAGYAWLSRSEASGVSETCPFLSQEL
ncbi:MAG: hypothetical protein AB9866_29005 [Syntrophobacteraceae bacterium]